MTNEELCTQIQNGHDEYIPELWDQVSDFIAWRAHKYLIEYPEYKQQLKDDMINQSYFYFLKAIETYDPERGKFINHLKWYIWNAFIEILQGGRSERLKQDPVNTAESIDAPIGGTEDLTIMDLLIDEDGESRYRSIEDRSFWDSVGVFLVDCLDHIQDKTGAEIVKYMYIHRCNLKAAVQALDLGSYETARLHHKEAMRQVKSRMRFTVNRERMRSIGLDEYIYTWGVRGWKNRAFTSSTEHSALKRIERSRNMLLSDVKPVKQYDDILDLLGM